MQKSYFSLTISLALAMSALSITLSGCGGSGAGPTLPSQAGQSVSVRSAPGPTPTPRLTPTPRPLPTTTPKPRATPTPSGPPAVSPPAVVFDLRGRALVSGVAQGGVVVQIKGLAGAVTAADRTVSGAGGFYSFFLGGGTYLVTASDGKHTFTRRVTIPPGGQTVDNFDLNL